MHNEVLAPDVEKLVDNLEALSKSDNLFIANRVTTILEFTDYFKIAEKLSLEEAVTKAINLDISTYPIRIGYILNEEERQTYYKLAEVEEITLRSEN